MPCMLDTGAEITVWNGSIEKFKKIFQGAELFSKDFKISGFGGSGLLYPVYKIPVFEISDGTSTVFIHNAYCAITEQSSLACRMILSANMFGMFDYTISNKEGILRIECERNEYWTIVTYDGSTTVFEQSNNKPTSNNPLLRAAMRADIK